uniref:Uncharacterized protein n=1 Tax=Pelagomonas calceolata TaxID=35677 RepID=A0A7S4E7H3_9STRA
MQQEAAPTDDDASHSSGGDVEMMKDAARDDDDDAEEEEEYEEEEEEMDDFGSAAHEQLLKRDEFVGPDRRTPGVYEPHEFCPSVVHMPYQRRWVVIRHLKDSSGRQRRVVVFTSKYKLSNEESERGAEYRALLASRPASTSLGNATDAPPRTQVGLIRRAQADSRGGAGVCHARRRGLPPDARAVHQAAPHHDGGREAGRQGRDARKSRRGPQEG